MCRLQKGRQALGRLTGSCRFPQQRKSWRAGNQVNSAAPSSGQRVADHVNVPLPRERVVIMKCSYDMEAEKWHGSHVGFSPEVRIRRACSRDLDEVNRLHERCSLSSLYSRYHGVRSWISPRDWRRLVDPNRGGSWIMEEVGQSGKIIAVANLILAGADSKADLGLLIEDSWQNQGLGTLFVAHLLKYARAFGCDAIIASVQSDNTPMLRLAFRYGALCSSFEDVMDLSIPVAVD